jgi:hypothetical protein
MMPQQPNKLFFRTMFTVAYLALAIIALSVVLYECAGK